MRRLSSYNGRSRCLYMPVSYQSAVKSARCSFAAILALVFFAGACASDGGGFGGGFASSCVEHSDCGDQLVCVSDACQSAFPRTYVFVIGSATIANYSPDGSAWDALGGAPDPRAALEVDGNVFCQTHTVQNSFNPTWNTQCEVEVFATTKIGFAVWDMDVSKHDPIGYLAAAIPLNDSFIKAGGVTQPVGKYVKSFSIDVSLK
jgi:hypothetical protein